MFKEVQVRIYQINIEIEIRMRNEEGKGVGSRKLKNKSPLIKIIRALASARGSVATRRVATGPRARRARGQRARPLEGPKGPRVAKIIYTICYHLQY